MKSNFIITLSLILCFNSCKTSQNYPTSTKVTSQINIDRISKMPDAPQPYKYKDWKATAVGFDNYVFDFNQKGEHLPLIWIDNQKRNFDNTTFGFYTAIGDIRMGPKVNNGENHEALGGLGAVVGATMVGIDKSNQHGNNYAMMLRNYFNKDNGWNVIMNFTNKGAHIGGGYGNDFWYEVHNNVLFYALAHFYPEENGFKEITKTIAEQFYKSDSIMGKSYSYSYFDFKEMKGHVNHIPTQEDVAGGYAFILYSAYIKFGDPKYLKAAKNALDVLYNQKENRFYEAMMPIAAHIAARMNAEQGTNYDLSRFINWTFNGDAIGREGWGVLNDKFGEYDVSGMAGSTIHNGGYGFLMNTFDLILPMTTVALYDQRYSNAVGKWILNASNAARFCYTDGLPDSLQALPHLKSITKNVLAYEGIIKESVYNEFKGRSPFAQGDGPLWEKGMPQHTMFSIYGSAHVGFFGGIIDSTNVPMILKVDCTKSDFYPKEKSFPTYLFYNPYSQTKEIKIDLGKSKVDVYDKISRTFIVKNESGAKTITIPAKTSRQLVMIPSGKKYTVIDGKLMVGAVTVDWRFGK